MKEKNPELIQFVLRGLNYEQFALIENAFNEGVEVKIGAALRVMRNDESRFVGFFSRVDFTQNETPFIIVETVSHFEIMQDSWNDILNKETNTLTIPNALALHLATISFGVTRGYLLSKVEKNIKFNRFFVPLITIGNIIKEDMVIYP